MFKCQKCEQSTDRPIRVVLERRMVSHLHNEAPRGPRGGKGSQIVKEISICAACVSSTPEAPLIEAEPVATTVKVAPGVTLSSHTAEDYAR